MQARIHRGSTEVGGNCIELRSGSSTILLDVGKPLNAKAEDHTQLPNAVGLGEPGAKPLAAIITHGHQDHWGLVPDLPRNIPIWIGAVAANILRAAEFWGPGVDLNESGHLSHRATFRIGPFAITPYLVDHSGFDAYALLVEADGRRLFYTGDIRGHGRKHGSFERLLQEPPPNIHSLVMEGTNLRIEQSYQHATESQVEDDMVNTLEQTDGPVVVLGSAQNIDRLVGTYRAALRSSRDLAIDLYTADVLAASGRETIPRLGVDWPRVHAYLPLHQRVKVKESGQFQRTQAIRSHRIFDENFASHPRKLVFFGSYQRNLRRMVRDGMLANGAVVWSMWDGYLAEPSGQRMLELLSDAGIPLHYHHASGHASVPDLKRLCDALAPEWVVPIHTDAPSLYASAFGRPVRADGDGKWWTV